MITWCVEQRLYRSSFLASWVTTPLAFEITTNGSGKPENRILEMGKEKNIIGPNDGPFVTGDGMLAFALYLAGIPFDDDKNWCRNEYTREMLREYGITGMDVRQAAMAAVKSNKHGKITFYFKRTQRLQILLRSYTDQEAQLSKEGSKVDISELCGAEMYADVRAVRLACIILKTRGQFMNGWKQLIPFITMRSEGRTEKSEFQFRDRSGRSGTGTQVSVPGITAFSANATDETLKKLGVL